MAEAEVAQYVEGGAGPEDDLGGVGGDEIAGDVEDHVGGDGDGGGGRDRQGRQGLVGRVGGGGARGRGGERS